MEPPQTPDRGVAGAVAASLLRGSAAVAALLLAYAWLPIRPAGDLGPVILTLLGLAVFVAIFVRQVRHVRRSERPLLRAAEAVAMVVTLFLVLVSSVHLAFDVADPAAYTEALSKPDAFYFSVVVMATVGFGDIAPVSAGPRLFTATQILLGALLIGVGIKVLVGAARSNAALARAREGLDTISEP